MTCDPPLPTRDTVYADPATGVVRLHCRTPQAAYDYLTDELVQVMAENAVMADVLTRLTHEFTDGGQPRDYCVEVDDEGDECLEPRDWPVHRTVNVIRGELGGEPQAEDLAAVNQRLTPPTPDVLRQLRDGLTRIGDQP